MTDDLITDDLAIVARASRMRPIAIEDTLRAVGAMASGAKPTSSIELLHLSRVFAGRVGRAVAGAASVACTSALLASIAVWRLDGGDAILDHLFYMSKLWVAVVILAIVFAAQFVASRVATTTFARALGVTDDRGRAHALVQRAAAWSIAGSIAGVTVFGLFFGTMQAVLGGAELGFMTRDAEAAIVDTRSWQLLTLWTLVAAIAASVAGALVVARSSERMRARWAIPAGLAILAATLLVGLRFDVGPITHYVTLHTSPFPSVLLRTTLTATGTLGMFLVVTGIVLGIRRREEAVLA